ncbi:enoyl-CoA hydratase/isomerase family protein [Aestuariivita sp.]|jgi:enoyl-CoA hydratase/carnithine racemase|uniref:enoyl-CoA hydratase/isomerase family protein n=1 Tax=Aestuariivita sp. TaxID=1872407 RepID=UPI00216D4E2D|nr:enoyl-CoA hydratase/isomerase family protein [Aestuariivita sp.]MCE8006564.1 enoyl-CoA hydratase/isomerase family protein [Aestuariivita sp.]
MTDIHIRIEGLAGRITLNRPAALNALTYEMCTAIEDAIDAWAADDSVALVLFDAAGDKAFCAGGDIAELYATGTKGDFAYGRSFWSDEYRLNAKLFEYPKPVVSLMQGFTMGGGVGLGCHGSHRVVGESSQIAMPECGIGLVPDVGGSLMLALAPGRLGEYLGVTGARMGPADAIYAGFADHYIPQDAWQELTTQLVETGKADLLKDFDTTPPSGSLAAQQPQIDLLFDGEALGDIHNTLRADAGQVAADALKALSRVSPLSAACTIEIVHRLRTSSLTIRKALEMEYRFAYRAMEHGDFLEGIRAQIIDKDRTPHWQFADGTVPTSAVSAMLQPLGPDTLTF